MRVPNQPYQPDQGGVSPFCKTMSNVIPEVGESKRGLFVRAHPITGLVDSPVVRAEINTANTDFVISIGGKTFQAEAGTVKRLGANGQVVQTITIPGVTANFLDHVIYGDNGYAVNGVNRLVEINSATNTAEEVPSSPKAKIVKEFKDFIIVANTSESPRMIQWSHLSDPRQWVKTSTNRAGFKRIEGINEIRDLVVVGDNLLILGDKKIIRMYFNPGGGTWGFADFMEDVGVIAQGAAATFDTEALILTTNGFYTTNAATRDPVGYGVVDRTFEKCLDTSRLSELKIFYVKHLSCFYVRCPGGEHKGTPGFLFNPKGRLWSTTTLRMKDVVELKSNGWQIGDLQNFVNQGSTTIQQLDIELGSKVLSGGEIAIEHIMANNKLQVFGGANLEAKIEISGWNVALAHENMPDRNYMLAEIRPLITGSRYECLSQAGAYNNLQNVFASDLPDARPLNSRGYTKHRAKGRFHYVAFTIPAGSLWEDMTGYEGTFRRLGAR